VFPLQLVEAFAHLALFLALCLPVTNAAFPGRLLLLYLIGSAAFRAVSDCWREASARPRVGPFSEAQVVSALVLLAGLVLISQ
jgi:prolipoprotein diacylglyceryltransferase